MIISTMQSFYHGHSGEGATIQDAICRAVLKAYGINLTHR
ncbi:hypothetical protein C2W64_04563 [Brevibacillus laterosporus]|nr:hypothetical protein C2W64_04563 [Brevibacillus laterosporus]